MSFDMNLLYRYTSLGRTLDPRLPTNGLIIGLTVLGGVISGLAALLGGGDFGAAVAAGFWAGAAVFMAWVVTREIDPDHPYSAFVSAGLALVVSLLLGAPALALLPLVAAVIGLRVINRVVGPPFRWTDSLAVLAVAALLAVTGHGLSALLLGAACALDGLLPLPLRRHLALAILAIALGAAAVALQPINVAGLAGETSTLIFVIVLAFGFLAITTHTVTSDSDVPGYGISVTRVQAAMAWLLVLAVVSGFAYGSPALSAYLPVWAALAGGALYRAGQLALAQAGSR